MQALLSEHWHAVRSLRPRLREGVQPLHRVLRGQAWVLLQDPVTQRFHRVTPPVWRVLALLDGQRTLDEVWEAACAAAGEDDAISQHDLVQLMGALYGQDLLQTQVSPDAGEVLARYRKQQRSQLKQRWLNPMSLRLPLLYPDRWFDGQLAIARALFSRTAALLWLLFVAPAAVLAWQHWGALTENLSDRVLSAHNLLLLWLTYPVVKSVHEWAHGLAVKAGGGTVREIGLMFIVFVPVPYVDATSSYRFPSKWARAGVAGAGILAELAIGAAAVYVWLAAEPGLLTALAFNVVLIAGVSTLLVNGNPLMRYDGYFVLSDLLELPNLAPRATSCWAWVFDRWACGAHDAQPPIGLPAGRAGRRERTILLVYGAIAPIYRLLITIGLIWFVAQEYLLVGAIMAIWAAWTAFVMPLWKGWKHLREAPGLARKRSTALRRTVGFLVVLALLIGAVPVPFHAVHQAVVWLPDEAIVRAEASGTVAASLPEPGRAVSAGQALLQLEDPRQTAELAVAAAAVAQAEAQLRQAEVAEPARAEPLRTELASRQARLGEAQRRHAALQVVARAAGRWVPAAATELPGRFVQRGEVLGYVVGGPSARVRTAVVQEDGDLIRTRLQAMPGELHRHVQVRLGHDMATVRPATVLRQVPGGGFNLVSAALGTSGGGAIAVDPAEPAGTRSLARVFDFELQLDSPTPVAAFGDRAWVRFDLGPAPLGWQWYLRLRQVFLAQLSV